MDIEYSLGETMHIFLNTEDLGSLATRGFCTIRKGLVGHESKTWIRQNRLNQYPKAIIDGDTDLNLDIPFVQQPPFTISKDAIFARNGDQSMVDWFFHDGSEIIVE